MFVFTIIGDMWLYFVLEAKVATLKPVPEAGPGGDADRDSVESPKVVIEGWQSGIITQTLHCYIYCITIKRNTLLWPICVNSLSLQEQQSKSWLPCFFVDEEDDDEYFEEEDMFSRLEESREKLENELGCDTFLKAYKAVQVSLSPQSKAL